MSRVASEPRSAIPAVSDCADCYSADERSWMDVSRRVRASALAPVLAALDRIHCRPDHITIVSLVVGLAFTPLYPIAGAWALLALLLHLALDGLDGPLARHQGSASRCGSFTDTMADQLVVTTSTLTLMHAGVVGGIAGSVYIITYAVVVIFAMLRNALGVPYSWLVRPRMIVYAWIGVELWWWPGSLDVVLWFFSALLAAKVLTGFVRIRRKLG